MKRIGIFTIMLILILGIPISSLAQTTKTHILMFSQGQEPQIAKMPQFAYIGTTPLGKDDKILDAVSYKAKGKDIYSKVLECHEKTYLSKGWNPAKMRMLVIVRNENKAFSSSGSVSISNSEGDSANRYLPGGSSKSTNSSMSSSGGIFPSFSKSWTDQKFEIWFFHVE